MRSLHIIMPMAGEGSRFLKEGWNTPKPLIKLNGKPLFLHAINSISIPNVPMKYSFIVRQEHIDKYYIDQGIEAILPEANIFSVLKTTRGAVETCLMAESVISPDDAILVMDCDLEFRSEEFNRAILEILSMPAEKARGGILVSFTSRDSRYSYAQTDASGNVIRTAEKEVISDHALCGAYFFASGNGFVNAAHRLLNDPVFTKPEYYLSLLYNYLINDGDPVRLAILDEYYSYGTPEELKRYL